MSTNAQSAEKSSIVKTISKNITNPLMNSSCVSYTVFIGDTVKLLVAVVFSLVIERDPNALVAGEDNSRHDSYSSASVTSRPFERHYWLGNVRDNGCNQR
jgi:hypothetical protein